MIPDLSALEQKRRRLWVERLHVEYNAFNYQYSLGLKAPIIVVDALSGRWGSWDPLTRTLTLAVRLIEGFRWDIVLEILKHEMAHQLVGDGPRPHGVAFSAACDRLRVAGWARSASGDPPAVLPSDPAVASLRTISDDDERLLRRAEKLLSLAQSQNEHESLLAMQRVQELYARHDLERLAARRDPAVLTLTLHLGKQRLSRVDSMLLMILSEHFLVRVIHGRLFDAADGCDYATADLIGTRPNVLMAEHVHAFLARQVDTLWQVYRRQHGLPAAAGRRDYQLGVLTGFHAKLTDAPAPGTGGADSPGTSSSEDVRALVAVRERELDDYVSYRYPRLATKRWSAGYRDAGSFEAGQADGRRIVISKGVSEGERGPRLLSS